MTEYIKKDDLREWLEWFFCKYILDKPITIERSQANFIRNGLLNNDLEKKLPTYQVLEEKEIKEVLDCGDYDGLESLASQLKPQEVKK